MKRSLWLMLLIALAPVTAHAHRLSNAFLDITVQGAEAHGVWDIAVRDLDAVVDVDADGDRTVTWKELESVKADIAGYALGRLQLTLDGKPGALRFDQLLVNDRVDGAYAQVRFSASFPGASAKPHALDVHYTLFFEQDPSHRGFVNTVFRDPQSLGVWSSYASAAGVARNLESERTNSVIMKPSEATHHFTRELPMLVTQAREFFTSGVWHIWTGIDHIAFLLVLLLPAVLLRSEGAWAPATSLTSALGRVVKVVTAFSLAHSITLTLAALNIVRLPGRFVESAIAASVVVAAIRNIFPKEGISAAQVAFWFGLLHGFGFAGVLAEVGLPKGALLVSLLSFNIGVEAGQVAIILAVLPVLYAIRATAMYRRYLFVYGSAVIGVVGVLWFVERAFTTVIF